MDMLVHIWWTFTAFHITLLTTGCISQHTLSVYDLLAAKNDISA